MWLSSWVSLHAFPVYMHLQLKLQMACFNGDEHLSQGDVHWLVDSAVSGVVEMWELSSPSIFLHLNMITQLTGLNSNNNNTSKLSVIYSGAATLTGHSVQFHHVFDPICE